MADRFLGLSKSDLTFLVDQKNSDRRIKQLLNSIITKYRDFVSVSQINYLPQPSASANN